MKKKKDHPFKPAHMPWPITIVFAFITLFFKVLGLLSPKLAGKLALKIFMKPPKAKPPRRENDIRNQADLRYRNINDRKIAIRVWENNPMNEHSELHKPTVLLSHGWAGRTTQFLEIIKPLVNAGYRVVGADLPAHGDSSGTHTNMLDASQVLSLVAKEFGPLEAIIGHSFGTGTTLLALERFGLSAPKIVLIGAYSRVTYIIDLFSEVFDFSQAIKDSMQQAATHQYADAYDVQWDWENIAPIETVRGYPGEILFIHDKEDNEVPLDEVTELHSMRSDAEIIITQGLGHRRILRDKELADSVVNFIKTVQND